MDQNGVSDVSEVRRRYRRVYWRNMLKLGFGIVVALVIVVLWARRFAPALIPAAIAGYVGVNITSRSRARDVFPAMSDDEVTLQRREVHSRYPLAAYLRHYHECA